MNVVYDGRTGAIVHVHESRTFEGAPARSSEEDEARAVLMAGRSGHKTEGLGVLQVESFDERVPQRVDTRHRRLVVLTKVRAPRQAPVRGAAKSTPTPKPPATPAAAARATAPSAARAGGKVTPRTSTQR